MPANVLKITHRIDPEQFKASMRTRGWQLTVLGWVCPTNRNREELDLDWQDAICEAIICDHEEMLRKKHGVSKT